MHVLSVISIKYQITHESRNKSLVHCPETDSKSLKQFPKGCSVGLTGRVVCPLTDRLSQLDIVVDKSKHTSLCGEPSSMLA